MYLSRLVLNPRSRAVQADLADCQHLHRTIMSAFAQTAKEAIASAGPRAQFGVLHRLEVDYRTGRMVLYVQSLAEPDWSALPEGYLATDMPADGTENPACRPVGHLYASIRPGTVLRFRLRANPTRKIDTKSGPNGERRNGRRVPLLREEDQLAWLERKGRDSGFRVLEVTMRGAGSEARAVGSHPQGRLVFQGVTYEGRLVVTDADRFRSALARGIGPGKAYGFGLLTVAPDRLS